MIQSGGVVLDIPAFGNILSNVAETGTGIDTNLGKNFVDKQIDKFYKQ